MAIILANEEKEVKKWSYESVDNNVRTTNDIVVTDKRIVYRQESESVGTQKLLQRTDLLLENVKGVRSSYGTPKGKNWGLILAVLGAGLVLLSVILMAVSFSASQIVMLVLGLACIAGGVYLIKKPITSKKVMFELDFETKTPEGSYYAFGGGSVALKGKKPYNKILLIVLCIIPPVALAYYLISKRKAGTGIIIPRDIAYEVIDTIGSLIV